MPLIDVHTHVGQFHSSAMSANGDKLCKLLKQGGITHAITFSAEGCFGAVDLGNRYTIAEVEKHSMLSALLVLHPHHYCSSVEILRKYADHPKVVGVKLHPHLGRYDILDRQLRRLIENEVAPRQLPILSHVANDSPNVPCSRYLHLASIFPETNFVAAHMGTGALGLDNTCIDAWQESRPTNVWFDLGTLRFFCTGFPSLFIESVGADRVCFGTDAPLYWPFAFSRTLESLGLSDETYERIAWKNAMTVFPRLQANLVLD